MNDGYYFTMLLCMIVSPHLKGLKIHFHHEHCLRPTSLTVWRAPTCQAVILNNLLTTWSLITRLYHVTAYIYPPKTECVGRISLRG